VSFRKGGSADPADPAAGAPDRPRPVLLAIGALMLSGLCAVIAAASLFKLRGWLDYTLKHPTKKPKKPLTPKQIHDQVSSIPGSQLVASIVVLLAVSLVAWSIWKGRYWARWAVLAIWVLSSFTGTLAGLNSLFAVTASIPNAFKLGAAGSAAFMLAAVVLVMLPTSGRYFALGKPASARGAAPRRGLFAPRPSPASAPARERSAGRAPATTRAARVAADEAAAADRSRTKKRTSAASVAKGADLARTRAKAASKSRRTES
jgi:hypothetical protein